MKIKQVVAMIGAVAVGLFVIGHPFTHAEHSDTKTAKLVYLTFDDGPTPGFTDEVLADLNAAGAHATFFEVGAHMEGNRALMCRLLAEGNQLGTHSWDHPGFGNITNGTATWEEIQRARSTQVTYTGEDSRLFRYPHYQRTNYGDLVLTYLGLQAVGADVQPQDYSPDVPDAAVIAGSSNLTGVEASAGSAGGCAACS